MATVASNPFAVTSAAAPAIQPAAVSAPSGQSLLQARQYNHVVGLDAAYNEGFLVLREAAGQDISAPNLLADNHAQYLAWRRALLKDRLVDVTQSALETKRFARSNRRE